MGQVIPVILIINGYAIGDTLVKHLRQHHARCIHIQTLFHAHDYYLTRFTPDYYEANLAYKGHFSNLLQQISVYQVKAVVACCDQSVFLADRLNQALGLPGNSPYLSMARVDKYHQRYHLQAARLSKTPFQLLQEKAQWTQWLQQHAPPYVVKPTQSVSADQVSYCQTPRAVAAAIKKISQHKSHYGLPHEHVLIEQYIQGREYRVNTVSWHGMHFVSDIWEMSKTRNKKGSFLYEDIHLVQPSAAEFSVLSQYMFRILDALAIYYGPGSADIKFNENGPEIVELGARLMGEIVPEPYLIKTLGYSQASLYALALTDSARYQQLTKKLTVGFSGSENDANGSDPSSFNRPHLSVYRYIETESGYIAGFKHLKTIQAMASVQAVYVNVRIGETIMATHDYGSSPIQMIFHHHDKQVLEQDLARVHQLATAGFIQFRNNSGFVRDTFLETC